MMKNNDMPSRSGAKPARKRLPLWAVVFWLIVWELLALWVAEPILLVTPVTALKRLVQLVQEEPVLGNK